MNAVTRMKPAPAGALESAWVRATAEERVLVDAERGVCWVGVAFSCLVRPETGDRVLVAWHEGGAHVLAVLERAGGAELTLRFPGAARLEAAGAVTVQATDLRLHAGRTTQVRTMELELSSAQTRAFVGDGELTGGQWVTRLRALHQVIDTLQAHFGQVMQRMKHCFRQVEGVDQSSAENALHTVRQTLTMRSDNTLISARRDVKVDGERIHMG